jgi:hypothetical protein
MELLVTRGEDGVNSRVQFHPLVPPAPSPPRAWCTHVSDNVGITGCKKARPYPAYRAYRATII